MALNFRTDPQAVRTLLARLLPNRAGTEAAVRRMAASIALAEARRPGGSSTTAAPSFVNLNVGRLYVFRILPWSCKTSLGTAVSYRKVGRSTNPATME